MVVVWVKPDETLTARCQAVDIVGHNSVQTTFLRAAIRAHGVLSMDSGLLAGQASLNFVFALLARQLDYDVVLLYLPDLRSNNPSVSRFWCAGFLHDGDILYYSLYLDYINIPVVA